MVSVEADVDVDVGAVVSELYGLRPREFVAARDAHAARARQRKQADAARRIGSLRRPTLALWAANRLSRARPDQARALQDLGAQLRAAHRDLDGAQLRALAGEQHRVIAALAQEAAALARDAGERISDSVLQEVEQVLHGVLADEDAGREWAAGHLSAAPEPTVGFAGLEPSPAASAAAARTATRTRKPPASHERAPEPARRRPDPDPTQHPASDPAPGSVARKRQERITAAREAAAQAEADLAQARSDLADATGERDRTRAAAAELADQVRQLRLRLEDAEATAAAARQRYDRAEDLARRAEQAAKSAAAKARAAAT